MAKVLITGSSGFVGSALARRLAADGEQIVTAVRKPTGKGEERLIGAIDGKTD